MRSFVRNVVCLLPIVCLVPGCLLKTSDLQHPDWQNELIALRSGKENLKIAVNVEARSGMITPAGLQTVRNALTDGPFTVRDSIDLGADLLIQVDAVKRSHVGVLAVFSLLTLLVIPGNMDYELDLSIDVFDRDKKVMRSYRRTSAFSDWLGWIFFAWGPAVSDLNAEISLMRDMARDVVREVYEKDYDLFRKSVK